MKSIVFLSSCSFFVICFGKPLLPEFTEPLKNITIPEGNNVEFSCNIRNLGGFRIMWLKRREQKEHFVAINLLKITKNERVTVSMLQLSDDVTQSTIYLRSVEREDAAEYECAINTNPLMSRVGILTIPEEETALETLNKTSTDQLTGLNSTAMNVLENSADQAENVTDHGCAEMKSYWADATDNIKDLLKTVFTSLVNFTCSFLTPSQ